MMRNLRILVCLLLLGPFLNAQIFEVDTLLLNGDVNKYINIVFMGDGYTEEELDSFSEDAQKFVNTLFLESPFQEYKNYFNAFAIRVPSLQSGVDHPGDATDVAEPVFPVSDVATKFESTFDYLGIHRLLVTDNSFMVYTVLAENFPMYDQPLVIVNSSHYGGAGGAIPTVSNNENSAELFIHELGHSFASLKDEYYAGDIYTEESVNMTKETDSEDVRWKKWLGVSGVGIHQHCCGGNSTDWYRPHNNCKMRFLESPFCSICKEAIIEKIHSLVSPLDSSTPEPSFVINEEPIVYKLNLIKPEPNTLKTVWTLNGEHIAYNVDSLQIDTSMLFDGRNNLSVFIEDTTMLLRKDNHHLLHFASKKWKIEKVESFYNEIEMYPNPAGDFLNLKTTIDKAKNIAVNIYDVAGKKLKSLADFIGLDDIIKIDLSGINNEVIIVEVVVDGVPYHTEQVMRP